MLPASAGSGSWQCPVPPGGLCRQSRVLGGPSPRVPPATTSPTSITHLLALVSLQPSDAFHPLGREGEFRATYSPCGRVRLRELRCMGSPAPLAITPQIQHSSPRARERTCSEHLHSSPRLRREHRCPRQQLKPSAPPSLPRARGGTQASWLPVPMTSCFPNYPESSPPGQSPIGHRPLGTLEAETENCG